MDSKDYIKDELYHRIVNLYRQTQSVRETALALGTYPIKVRRVLITEGVWHSKRSDEIGALYERGVSVADIARRLFISEQNVQSYIPYTRGLYCGEQRSNDAKRSDEYRRRMRCAAMGQAAVNARSDMSQAAVNSHIMDDNTDRHMRRRRRGGGMEMNSNKPYAFKLHLELNTGYLEESQMDILKKYGKVKKGITRDFIVPGDMTFHALHYAINKAFGWQNSHLHSFHPYQADYDRMIRDNSLEDWGRLSGLYFRFPTGDFEDLYWDDDYREGQSVKSWMRKKYTGPYTYGGTREFYYCCQDEVRELYERWPELEVSKPFHVWMEEKKALEQKGQPDNWPGKLEKVIPIRTATVDELINSITFDGGFDEILERLPICDVLLPETAGMNWDVWNLWKYKAVEECEDAVDLEEPETVPCLSAVQYRYDYGDGWRVCITCTDTWRTREELESAGYDCKTLDCHRPVCVEADGLALLDDVGGISGYCDMLKTLHGDDPDEIERKRAWASMMGWTGRRVKAENIL